MELPPLARGKVQPLLFYNIIFGITPARAGKSGCLWSVLGQHGNYPRSRGEKHVMYRLEI